MTHMMYYANARMEQRAKNPWINCKHQAWNASDGATPPTPQTYNALHPKRTTLLFRNTWTGRMERSEGEGGGTEEERRRQECATQHVRHDTQRLHELASFFFLRFFPSVPASGPCSLSRFRADAAGTAGASTPAGFTKPALGGRVRAGVSAGFDSASPKSSREAGGRIGALSRTSSWAVFARAFEFLLSPRLMDATGALKPDIEVGRGSNFERDFGRARSDFVSSSCSFNSPSSTGFGLRRVGGGAVCVGYEDGENCRRRRTHWFCDDLLPFRVKCPPSPECWSHIGMGSRRRGFAVICLEDEREI